MANTLSLLVRPAHPSDGIGTRLRAAEANRSPCMMGGIPIQSIFMFGAFWTHVANGEVPGMIATIVMFVLLVAVGRLRLQAFLTRFPFQ